MAGLSLSPVPGVDFACTAVRRCATQRCCIQLRDIQSSFLGRICHLLVLPSPVALRCVTEVKSYVSKIAYCVVQWSIGLTLQKWTAARILSSFSGIYQHAHAHTHMHTRHSNMPYVLKCVEHTHALTIGFAKAPAVCSVWHWLAPTTSPTEIEQANYLT